MNEITEHAHDWELFWDGSLGYTRTDRCTICGDYRPTPKEPDTPSSTSS